MTFEQDLIDLGEVRRGEIREMTFKFTNTGTMDFMIEIVSSCECTTVEWPVAKVFKPGESGEIRAVFDSSDKEKSETVDVDIILRENDPATGYPAIITPQYKFILVQ